MCGKSHPFLVYNSVYNSVFNLVYKHVQSSNHHHSQDIEHYQPPAAPKQIPSYPFAVNFCYPQPLTTTNCFSVPICFQNISSVRLYSMLPFESGFFHSA